MSFIDRLSAGWTIAISSFKVLKEKKELIIFPMMSAISVMLVVGSFFTAIYQTGFFESESGGEEFNTPLNYLVMLAFYLVNYFVIIFFNVALVHCTRLYFRGEEFTLGTGLRFSMSRIAIIFSWAFFSATIGLLLRVIQENVGWLGKILLGLIGVVWSVATFFVIPVIAFEKVGPVDAVKRSSQIMKEKWGESLGATFSFGLIQFVGMLAVGLLFFLAGYYIHPLLGIGLAVVGVFLVFCIISAAEMIFISAAYHNINGDIVKHFDRQMVDDLFESKK